MKKHKIIKTPIWIPLRDKYLNFVPAEKLRNGISNPIRSYLCEYSESNISILADIFEHLDEET